MPPAAPTNRICSVKKCHEIAGSPRTVIASAMSTSTLHAISAHAPVANLKAWFLNLRKVFSRLHQPCADERYRDGHRQQHQPETDNCRPVQRVTVGDVRLRAGEFAGERLARLEEWLKRKWIGGPLVVLPADDEKH